MYSFIEIVVSEGLIGDLWKALRCGIFCSFIEIDKCSSAYCIIVKN